METIIQIITTKEKEITIQIIGSFEYNIYSLFKKAFEDKPKDTIFSVDLTQCSRIDCCAFGMLLILPNNYNKRKFFY